MAAKKKSNAEYGELLRDPRWQKRRLKILERDAWRCRICGENEKQLHVHHRYYENGAAPWDYPDAALCTLCESCHKSETANLPAAKRRLMQAISIRFFSAGFDVLADGFEAVNLGGGEPDDLVALAISRLISDKITLQDSIEKYLNKLKAKLRAAN